MEEDSVGQWKKIASVRRVQVRGLRIEGCRPPGWRAVLRVEECRPPGWRAGVEEGLRRSGEAVERQCRDIVTENVTIRVDTGAVETQWRRIVTENVTIRVDTGAVETRWRRIVTKNVTISGPIRQ